MHSNENFPYLSFYIQYLFISPLAIIREEQKTINFQQSLNRLSETSLLYFFKTKGGGTAQPRQGSSTPPGAQPARSRVQTPRGRKSAQRGIAVNPSRR